ncbi:golgin subfamily A member 6-like protein 6 [Palaemon carinicauda]|uniref:golgin subfamily A member 6-like protein 6 n=1 Tax=Palaemon carinicauda TaxID=392227 RepID=UPI0035B5ABD2
MEEREGEEAREIARQEEKEREQKFIAKQGSADLGIKGMKAYRNVEAEIQRIAAEENLLKLKMMVEWEEREQRQEKLQNMREKWKQDEKIEIDENLIKLKMIAEWKKESEKKQEKLQDRKKERENRKKKKKKRQEILHDRRGEKPLKYSPTTELERDYPYMFPSCVTTRSITKKEERETKGPMNLEDLLIEEDSLNGMQEDSSRETPREEERQMNEEEDMSDRGTIFTFVSGCEETVGCETTNVYYLSPGDPGCIREISSILKSMLTKYCNNTGNEWDIGLLLMLFEVRKTYEERRDVARMKWCLDRKYKERLKGWQKKWKDREETDGKYSKNLRKWIGEIRKFPLENLKTSQGKMKKKFDMESNDRTFAVGQ